jgi:amino acid transporter
MSQVTLARRTLGAGSLLVFAVGASSPLTVLVGGVVTTFALTGVQGVPLSFLVIMAVLSLLLVGYVAMARKVQHSAPFFAQLARGFNPAVGAAGAAVALLGYNAIQISLYGLIGVTMAGLLGGPWWAFAAGAWLLVAGLGRFRGAANAAVLGSLLLLELATIVLFDIAAFADPAEGSVSLMPLMPANLAVPGISGVLAFAMAAFTGGESPPAFSEEARTATSVLLAAYGGIVFLGVFYAITAWAYAVAVGPDQVVEAASDPDRAPLALLGRMFGPGLSDMATLLLVTSVLAAMAAFHATVSRYVFALARERVLPARLARVSDGMYGGAPLGGSMLQSLVAGVVVGVFAVVGAEPMTTMFVWLSTIGATAILLLLTLSSLAARAFFTRGYGTRESLWVRQIFPVVGAVVGLLVLVFMASNLASLLGTAPGSSLPWLVPALVAAFGLTGLVWGGWLKRTRPHVYERLGQGTPNPLTVQDHRLADVRV